MAEEIGALRAMLALETAAFDKGVASARRQLTGLEGGFQKTGGQVVQFGQRMSRDATAGFNSLNRSAGASRAGLQNFGNQVQDVAVQIAGGTSATRALSQQLPQLLSGFGLFGIAAGAAAAVLIPLGSALLGAKEKAESFDAVLGNMNASVKALEETSRAFTAGGLTDLIEKYGEASAAVLLLIERQRQLAVDNALGQAKAAIAATNAEIDSLFTNRVGDLATFLGVDDSSVRQVDNFGNAIRAVNPIIADFEAGLKAASSAATFEEQADAVSKLLTLMDGTAAKGSDLYNSFVEAESALRAMNAAGDGVNGWLDGAIVGAGDLAGQLWEAARAALTVGQNQSAAAARAAAQIAVDDGMVYSGRGGDPRQFMAGESGSFNRDLFQMPKLAGGGARRSSGGGGGMSETAREAARVFAETRTEAEKYAIEVGKLNKLLDSGGISQDTFNRAMDGMKEKTDELAKAADRINESFEGAFADIATGAKSLEEGLSGVLKNLADMMAQSAALKLNTALFGSAGVGGKLAGVLGFADGGAFANGRVQAFASGGIVNSPTVFPMANGAGLMGEAGPEAIMPLTRIGGKLGVRAAGGGGSVVNIDARYATEGTAAMIVKAIQQAAPGIVKQSVFANRAAGARGY
jgi:hypothetical protein